MKRKTILMVLFISLMSCEKEEVAPQNEDLEPSKTQLLTADTQKSWYIVAASPEEPCGSASDDSWIFKSDGTFEFDHGTVTEDEAGECSDFINLTGTWEFTDSETGLKLFAERGKDDPSVELNLTLFDAKITELTDDKLSLSQEHNGTTRTVEFRKR